MKQQVLYAIFHTVLILLFACNSGVNHDERMRRDLDELKRQLDSLKNTRATVDSITPQTSPTSAPLNETDPQENEGVAKSTPIKEEPSPQAVTPKKNPDPSSAVVKTDEGEKRYYKSGKLSLVITPWKDDLRELIFYDPFGNITYTQEDVRHSYSSVSEVKGYHSNGAVSGISVHNNPGASMYWSEAFITFNDSNEPLSKTVTTYPMQTIQQNMDNIYLWDRSKGDWVKQKNEE